MSAALIVAVLSTAAIGGASYLGNNQIVPGVDSQAPAETNMGVKALALSAVCAGIALSWGDPRSSESVARGALYAAGLASLVGVGLIVRSQFKTNAALARL